jgi:hypothetical protein
MALQTRIVTLQPITSATPCSAANEDDLISRVIPERLVGYIQLPTVNVVVSTAIPGADDTDSIWIKTDDQGRPEDIRKYFTGVWYRVENEQIGAVKWLDVAEVTATAYTTENPAWQAFTPALQKVQTREVAEQNGAVKWLDTSIITAAAYVANNPAWQVFAPPITQTFGGVTLEAVRYIGIANPVTLEAVFYVGLP